MQPCCNDTNDDVTSTTTTTTTSLPRPRFFSMHTNSEAGIPPHDMSVGVAAIDPRFVPPLVLRFSLEICL